MELGEGGGYFSLKLTKETVEVRHNGKPFDKEDVKRICMSGGSKKPRQGYKGWMGVGFKSVFKVSNKVYIHSKGEEEVSFEFNKDYWFTVADELKRKYSLDPEDVPWQSVPIPVKPLEPIIKGETIIRIYLLPGKFESLRGFLNSSSPLFFCILSILIALR